MLSLASMPVPKEYSLLEAFFLDQEIWNTIKPRNEYSDKKIRSSSNDSLS